MVLVVKNLPANTGDIRDWGLVLRSGRSPGGWHGSSLQYSCLENPMGRGAWLDTVHRVAQSQTQLKWLSILWDLSCLLFKLQVPSSYFLRKVLVAQSYLTLCNPIDCSLPDSSVHGILQARIPEWAAMPSSRGSSWPRDWTCVSHTVGRFFTIWATREAPQLYDTCLDIPGQNSSLVYISHNNSD